MNVTVKKKPVRVHYVDNKRFFEEILEHKRKMAENEAKGLESPRLNNYIGEVIWKIAMKLSTKPCFINYSYRDEMISDGIENCIKYFNDFDPEKGSNPFAYFTQVIYFAFLRRINEEEKKRYTIYKNFQETIINHGHANLLMDGDDNHLIQGQMYDNINEFMDRFEKKEEAKKIKRKQTKEGLSKFYEEQNEQHTVSGGESNQLTPEPQGKRVS
jgi:hypothetical protein